MAFLADIFGAGSAANLGGKIVDVVGKFIPDTNAQAAAKVEIEKMLDTQEFTLAQGQQDINKIEAASPSFWVSGARPAVLWTCVGGLVYQFLVFPFLVWGSTNWGWTSPPSLELSTLNTLLFGLLGLSTMRTVERIKGVASDQKQ